VDIKKVPWMAEEEITIMASLFGAQQPKRVLEWGAGGSTLYWPLKYDFIRDWVTIEHNKEFAQAVAEKGHHKVLVMHEEAPEYWRAIQHAANIEELLFDMIIVDGRHRVKCLEVARDLLADKGIVVLHDSGRPAYNEAWKVWSRREELYPGEKPTEEGYYRHRGITVFWKDKGVRQAGWCREYQAEPLKRPRYKKPRRPKVIVEAEEVETDGLHTSTEDGFREPEHTLRLP